MPSGDPRLATHRATNRDIAFDEPPLSGKSPAASNQCPDQIVKKFAIFPARRLTGKIYSLSSNEAVSKLSNLKRPDYGHTSSVPE
jgi:hypothetical protein